MGWHHFLSCIFRMKSWKNFIKTSLIIPKLCPFFERFDFLLPFSFFQLTALPNPPQPEFQSLHLFTWKSHHHGIFCYAGISSYTLLNGTYGIALVWGFHALKIGQERWLCIKSKKGSWRGLGYRPALCKALGSIFSSTKKKKKKGTRKRNYSFVSHYLFILAAMYSGFNRQKFTFTCNPVSFLYFILNVIFFGDVSDWTCLFVLLRKKINIIFFL